MKIFVVGLGPGDAGEITAKTWDLLHSGRKVYLRTKIHPSVKALEEAGIKFETFDYLYNSVENFEILYESIVGKLIELAKEEEIIYAVPGSPQVAEKTVKLLQEKLLSTELEILAGMSFLELLYNKASIDPVDGLFVVDGVDLQEIKDLPKAHLVITQIYNKRIASEVKLSLMEFLHDETEVTIIHHLGLNDEIIDTIPLYKLDRLEYIDYLTSAVITKDNIMKSKNSIAEDSQLKISEIGFKNDIQNLVEVMDTLLGPNGCPWDKKQTHLSLRKYLIEETNEVLQAIDRHDMQNLEEELGDLLLQIVFHAALAQRNGCFDLNDVIAGITNKMIRRHPHVFADELAETPEAVNKKWEEIKKREKGHHFKYLKDEFKDSLSALVTAQKIQEKVGKLGFMWDDVGGIWNKINEEIIEFKESVSQKNHADMELEAGDILFSLISLLQWYKISGENALRQANDKFLQRFSYIEDEIRNSGKEWSDFTLAELDLLWQQAKSQEKY